MNALPSTYRSAPVIPFAPTGANDRKHGWDWTAGDVESKAGPLLRRVDPTAGRETVTLTFDGLSRSDARTLESFINDRLGRKEAFWCPTFQHHFGVVQRPAAWSGMGTPPGNIFVREWGYAGVIYPLGLPYRHFAAAKNGLWLLDHFTAVDDLGAPAIGEDGQAIFGYSISGFLEDIAGTLTAAPLSPPAMVSRMLWARLVDDSLTTAWDHPHLASVTFSVVDVAEEAA